MFSRKTVATAIAAAIVMTAAPAALAQGNTATAPVAQTVDFKASADAFLKANAAQYGLKGDLSDLSYITTVDTDVATYVRYQQLVDGAEVFYNQVNVTLDKSGNGVLIVSDYQPVTSVEKPGKKISENDAETKAKNYNIVKDVTKATSRKFGYMIENGVAIPTYKVTTTTPDHTWETYVHAGSGKVLKNKDVNQKVSGSGQVFSPNPLGSAGTVSGFADNNDADTAALTGQLKAVTLLGLDGSGYLRGDYVYANAKKNKAFSSTNTFNYTRSADEFEQVMVYYHIDSMQRWIQSLGFTNVNNRQQFVNVNGSTQDNSWYSPSTKELTFGTGGVDDAEDAGIIGHEYGHSIQDNQVPGWGNSAEGGAMGEGFGDYLGAIWEDKNDGGAFTACIGEWDAVSYSSSNPPCLRRLDKNKVYPQDFVNQVHSDGQIWSQPTYELAYAIGFDAATKLILQSHFSLTPNTTFHDAGRAIKQADVLINGGANGATIDSIFNARGIQTN